jgi:hypothetical protein
MVGETLLVDTRPRGAAGVQCGGFETRPGDPASAAAGCRVSFHWTEEGRLRCDVSRGWGTQGGEEEKEKEVSVRVQE